MVGSTVSLERRPEGWDEVIANGRTYVERERTWKDSVARYRDVYDRARGHARRTAGTRNGT